jgi:hypothetical protein
MAPWKARRFLSYAPPIKFNAMSYEMRALNTGKDLATTIILNKFIETKSGRTVVYKNTIAFYD